MEPQIIEIEVTCPICQTVKNLNVPETVFSQKKFGTIKIQVPPGAVCPEHQFIVFVDSKGNIRGYERIDIQMSMPTEETEREAAGVITLRKLIQMFGMYGVFSMMHAKIFNYPVSVIVNENFNVKADIINAIGNSMLPSRYKGKSGISYIEEPDLSKIKLKEKNVLLMDSQQHIFQTPWEEKLKFEESIVKKALEIIDEEEQLIIIQQAIAKLIKESEFTKDVLEIVDEIYEDDLIDKISSDLMIPKINHFRLGLIKSFIKQWFSPKLTTKIRNKVEEFLDLL